MARLDRPILGVVIVNYHSIDYIVDSVESVLLHAGKVPIHFAIHDNAGERQLIVDRMQRLISPSGLASFSVSGDGANLGFGAGCDVAARSCLARGADVLWFLNPDARMTHGSPDAAVFEVLSRPLGLYGTATAESSNSPGSGIGFVNLWTGATRRQAPHRSRSWLPIANGYSFLTQAIAFRDLGGFSRDYFLYYEEADLAYRAQRSQMVIGSTRNIVIDHTGGVTTRGQRGTVGVITRRHSSRSSIIFFRTHLPKRAPLAIASRLIFAVSVGLSEGLRPAVAVAKGTVQGATARLSKPLLSIDQEQDLGAGS